MLFSTLITGAPGLEPGNAGAKVPCLTIWRRPMELRIGNFIFNCIVFSRIFYFIEQHHWLLVINVQTKNDIFQKA